MEEFYSDYLNENKAARLVELGRRSGHSEHKIQKALEEGKVRLPCF